MPSGPQTLQYLFQAEIFLNCFGGALMILRPSSCLSFLLFPPTSSIPISLLSSPATTPLAIWLFQWLGAITIALAIPLILCDPNFGASAERRRLAYWTLFAGEAALVPVMMWQWALGGVFSRFGLGAVILGLGATGVGRLWVLLRKEEWFVVESAAVKKNR